MMGGSIIIFIDMSIEVMIKLMMRNGMKIRNLILKVVLSLLIINVGIRMFSGVVCGVVGLVLLVMFIKIFRFFLCICDSMNF